MEINKICRTWLDDEQVWDWLFERNFNKNKSRRLSAFVFVVLQSGREVIDDHLKHEKPTERKKGEIVWTCYVLGSL